MILKQRGECHEVVNPDRRDNLNRDQHCTISGLCRRPASNRDEGFSAAATGKTGDQAEKNKMEIKKERDAEKYQSPGGPARLKNSRHV